MNLIEYMQTLRHIKVQTKSKIIRLIGRSAFGIPYKNDNGTIYTVITIDTEQDDKKKYINTGSYRGIEEGAFSILDILDDYNCKANWMVTPDVAINYPDILKLIFRR